MRRTRARPSRNFFGVKWKKSRTDGGTPLDDLVSSDDFPAGGAWAYNDYFAQVDVILAHGHRPSAFGLCQPDEDLAIMMAHNDRKVKMSHYDEKQRKKKLPKAHKK